MTRDPETLKVYSAKADEYAALTGTDGPSDDLARFIAALPQGGRVLDIGCGPGQAAGFMAAAGLMTEAWDPVPEMRALAMQHDRVTVKDAGFEDLTVQAVYDGIWANFSMLHTPLADWAGHFEHVRRALKPGGVFHFGTKLGTGEIRDKIGRKYSYMEDAPLRALITKTGFAIDFARAGEEPGLSGEIAPFIILQARAHA